MGRAIALLYADAGPMSRQQPDVIELEEVAEGVRAKGRKGLAVVADAGKTET